MFVKTVVSRLGGSGEIARRLGLPEASGPAAVRGWVLRDSIPPEQFKPLAGLARQRGCARDINVDTLLAHAQKRAEDRRAKRAEDRTAA